MEKLGAEIEYVDVERRSVTLAYNPDAFFLQAMNVMQGGAVSMMLDYTLAAAVLAALPDGHTTASTSLAVSFIKPALPGRLIAVGVVDHVGRTCAFARGTIAREDGVIVATASSNLSVFEPRT